MDKISPNTQKQQNTRSSSGLSQQISLEEQKKRKFIIRETIYLIYYLLRIAMTILILVIVNDNIVQTLQQTTAYLRMQQNIGLWKSDVIINITTVNSYNCPEGYQTYSSYNWPGTKQGCYCYTSLGTYDYVKILQGACSSLAVQAGCVRIQPMNPIPYLFWKKDELICIKRIKNLNFFTDLNQMNISQNQCGQNTDYQLTIPSNLSSFTQCPITNIVHNDSLFFQLKDINFSYSRQDSYPIVKLRMTEYEFCPDFTKQNISPFKQRNKNYNLQNILREFCYGKDQRVVVVDQIGQDQLFRNNPRIKDATSRLPSYPQPILFLIFRIYSLSCLEILLQKIIRFQFIHNLNTFKFRINFSIQFNLFNINFDNFCNLWIDIYFFLCLSKNYGYLLQKQNIKEIQRRKPNLYEQINKTFSSELFIFGLKFIVAVSCITILAVLQMQMTTYFQWYKSSQKCTQKNIIYWLQYYKEYFQNQQTVLLFSIILILSLLCIDVMMFCWRAVKQDLRIYKKQQSVANMFDQQQIQEKQLDRQKNSLSDDQNTNSDKKIKNTTIEQILQTQQNFMESNNGSKNMLGRPVRQKRPIRKKRLMSMQMTQFSDQIGN